MHGDTQLIPQLYDHAVVPVFNIFHDARCVLRQMRCVGNLVAVTSEGAQWPAIMLFCMATIAVLVGLLTDNGLPPKWVDASLFYN